MSDPTFGRRRSEASLAVLQKTRMSREHRLSLTLAAVLTVIWMVFILLVAFAKGLLATSITSGLTLGLLLAFIVVIVVWLLALLYFLVGNREAPATHSSEGRP
jgi:uncharacterized membrane protein (DUF485 family)